MKRVMRLVLTYLPKMGPPTSWRTPKIVWR